jgi:hypothetical protein
MPDTEGVPSTSAATAESAALADNIIKFPSTNIAFDVGSALDEVMEAYDKRREMLAVAFKIANLSSAQLNVSPLPPSPGSRDRTKSPAAVSRKREYLRSRAETFGDLADQRR